MGDANRQEPATRESRSKFGGHLWWLVEACGILACIAGWLFVREPQLLVYALTTAVLLSLVFRLTRPM